MIEMMGKRFREQEVGASNQVRPLVFVLPGLCSNSKTPSCIDIVREGKAKGFDVVVINYRGFGGVKLSSPKIYCGSSQDDVRECLEHICSKYYSRGRPKLFGVGISMGGNILGNLLAFDGMKNDSEENYIEAAFVIGSAGNLGEAVESLKTSCFGAYDRALAKSMTKNVL